MVVLVVLVEVVLVDVVVLPTAGVVDVSTIVVGMVVDVVVHASHSAGHRISNAELRHDETNSSLQRTSGNLSGTPLHVLSILDVVVEVDVDDVVVVVVVVAVVVVVVVVVVIVVLSLHPQSTKQVLLTFSMWLQRYSGNMSHSRGCVFPKHVGRGVVSVAATGVVVPPEPPVLPVLPVPPVPPVPLPVLLVVAVVVGVDVVSK